MQPTCIDATSAQKYWQSVAYIYYQQSRCKKNIGNQEHIYKNMHKNKHMKLNFKESENLLNLFLFTWHGLTVLFRLAQAVMCYHIAFHIAFYHISFYIVFYQIALHCITRLRSRRASNDCSQPSHLFHQELYHLIPLTVIFVSHKWKAIVSGIAHCICYE